MVPRRFRLIALALMLAVASAQAGAEDARVEEADALLGDAAGYERAIALYREVLAVRPEDAEVRLRLARVLAWSRRYGESLAEFDVLLAADVQPASARVERAEVLSWEGSLALAEREFVSLLAADPNDARAARGLARVQLWSGRLGRADQSYARALALQPDSEAEVEYRRLRAGWKPWLRPGVGYAVDSDDFEWLRAEVESGFYRTATTTLRARAGYHRVSHPQDDVALEARANRSSDQASELGLGLERSFELDALSAPVRVDLDTGIRLWQHADETVTARGRVEIAPWEASVIGVEGRTGDHLDESASFEALQERLRASGGNLSLWKGLGSSWELFSSYDLLFVDDGNRRHSADATVSYLLFSNRETRLHLGASWVRYVHRSPFYYDPSSDIGLMVRATDRFALAEGLSFAPAAGVGFGSAHDGERSSGFTFELTGELAYKVGDWHFAVYGGRSQSRRARLYTWDHVSLRITREFGTP